VTSPGYIIQDLTQSGHDEKLLEWNAQLWCQPGFSQLSTIVLKFSYKDDAALEYTDYYNDNSQSGDLDNNNNNNSENALADNLAAIFALKPILNFIHSIQVVWKRQSRKEWVAHRESAPPSSLREKYFFSSCSNEHNLGFIHINKQEAAKEWRGSIEVYNCMNGYNEHIPL
jgi:hypothetical protein